MPDRRLLFVGQAVLDQVFGVEALDAGAGKHVARSHAVRPGGLAVGAALAALRLRDPVLPREVALVGACGDDAAGAALRTMLASLGLLTDALTIVPQARTGVSAVLVDAAGERRVESFRGDALARAPLPPATLLDGAAALQADPRWPDGAAWALHEGRRRGLPTLLDAELAPTAVLRRLLPLAGWAVFSRDGLRAWAGDAPAGDATTTATAASAASTAAAEAAEIARLEAAAAAAPGAELVVTRGAEGATWRRPDGTRHALPAFRVPVRDTNGAGDTLHGALLLGLAEGRPPAEALRRAMAAAALACTGTPPTRADLDRFLETA
jgi:sulfofructose kinase